MMITGLLGYTGMTDILLFQGDLANIELEGNFFEKRDKIERRNYTESFPP